MKEEKWENLTNKTRQKREEGERKSAVWKCVKCAYTRRKSGVLRETKSDYVQVDLELNLVPIPCGLVVV